MSELSKEFDESKDDNKDNKEKSIMPVLDRFMIIMSKLFRKQSSIGQWTSFRTLLLWTPLDYSKIYSQLSRIQRGSPQSSCEIPMKRLPRSKSRNSNAHWDDYSNEYSISQPEKKKSSSVYRHMQQTSTKEPSKQSNLLYMNTEYHHKPQQSTSRYYELGKQESTLKDSRGQNTQTQSSSKINKQPIMVQDVPYTSTCMIGYLKEENARLPTNKPELMRTLSNSYIIRSQKIYEQVSVLAVGFFIVLLRDAYADTTQSPINIWEIYNKVVNRAFTYSNANDCAVFLRLLNKLLNKKYSTDNQKRYKYFLKEVYADSHLLHISERIYKETIQEKKITEGLQGTARKVSYSSRKKQPSRQQYTEYYKDFAQVFPLRVYSVRDGSLIFESYGDEQPGQNRLSIVKKSTHFYLIIEEQSEYAGSLEITNVRTIQSSKSFKNLDTVGKSEPKQTPSNTEPPLKRQKRILSRTQSIGKHQLGSIKLNDYRYSQTGSNADIRSSIPPAIVFSQPQKDILSNQIKSLIDTLNSNNNIVNGLVKDDHKYQPLKSPLVSLDEVYSLMGLNDSKSYKHHQK